MSTVKEINHDSSAVIGNHYSSVTDVDGAIAVNGTAALNGTTYGVEMDYDAGTNDVVLVEGFTYSDTELRMRFRANINDVAWTGPGGANLIIVRLKTSSDGDVLFALRINVDSSEIFDIVLTSLGDSGSIESNGGELPQNNNCFELRAIRASSAIANDGEVEVFVNGVSVISITDMDNFTDWNDIIDQVEVNFPSPAGLSGTMYYDEWILDNDNTVDLGCKFSGYNLILGGGQP